MEAGGRSISLEDIENLLKWQYSHLVELDDFLMTRVKGYKSIFLQDSAWYNRAFVGQTIIQLNQFRNGVGKGLLFQYKPFNDFIDEIDSHNKWLVAFKAKRKAVDGTYASTGSMYIGLQAQNLILLLSNVNALIVDLEYEHVKNLDSSLAKRAVRKKLFELESEKIKTSISCRLRDSSREKEQKLYELLDQYLSNNDASKNPEARLNEKEQQSTIIYTINNIGDGNIINAGHQATIKAQIDQNNT